MEIKKIIYLGTSLVTITAASVSAVFFPGLLEVSFTLPQTALIGCGLVAVYEGGKFVYQVIENKFSDSAKSDFGAARPYSGRIQELIQQSVNESGNLNLELNDEEADAFCNALCEALPHEEISHTLKALSIGKKRFSPNTLKQLFSTSNLKRDLTRITIDGQPENPSLLTTLADSSANHELTRLKELTLSACGLSLYNIESLPLIGRYAAIEVLNLSGNVFSLAGPASRPEQWTNFAQHSYRDFPHLKTLNLSGCLIAKAQVPQLLQFLHPFSVIETLDLSGNQIHDEGFKALLESDAFQLSPSLKTVKGYHKSGHRPDVIAIRQAIELKEERVARFIEKANLTHSEHIPFSIISAIIDNDENMIGALKSYIAEVIPSKYQAQSILAMWQEAAAAFQEKCDGSLTLSNFIDFIREYDAIAPDPEKLFLKSSCDILEKAETGEELTLAVAPIKVTALPQTEVATALSTVLQGLQDRNAQPVLKKIQISNMQLTSALWNSLMVSGMGSYKTEHLDLSHNALYSNPLNEEFFAGNTLRTINLSHNKLTAKALPGIIKFCQQHAIEHLDLSHNPLFKDVPSDEWIAQRWWQLCHTTALKTLSLNHIDWQGHYNTLKAAIEYPTQLLYLNIEAENRLVAAGASVLRTMPEFVNQVGLVLNTGYPGVRQKVRKALTKQQKNTNAWQSAMSDTIDNTRPAKYQILDKYLANLDEPNVPASLRRSFESTKTHGFYKKEAALLLCAGLKPGFDTAEYQRARMQSVSAEQIAPYLYFHKLYQAEPNESIDIVLTAGSAKSIINGLSKSLAARTEPLVIKKLVFSGLSLTHDHLSELIESNVFEHGVETIDLSNNQLTDHALPALADLVSGLENLCHLNLANNRLTAAGLLTFFKHCANLKLDSLNLSDNLLVSTPGETASLKALAQQIPMSCPTLTQVSLNNVVNAKGDLKAITPLLATISVLQQVNISQQGYYVYDYLEFLQAPQLQAPTAFMTITTGKEKTKTIQRHQAALKKQAKQLCPSYANQGEFVTLKLLTEYVIKPRRLLPESQTDWHRAHMRMANTLRYYRQRARLQGIRTANTVSLGEYAALRQHTLPEHWALSSEPLANDTLYREQQAAYQANVSQSKQYYAESIIGFNLNNQSCLLTYGDDETLRFFNTTQGKQWILNRFALAMAMPINNAKQYTIGSIKLLLNGRGDVHVTLNDEVLATVAQGQFQVHPDKMMPSKTIDVSSFRAVTDLNSLFENQTVPAQIAQYQQRQQAAKDQSSQPATENTARSRSTNKM